MKEISLLLNVVVLVFEVLYYTLFMKFARKEGKFWRYLLLFSAITIFFCFVGTKQFYSYLLLIIMMLLGMKFLVKTKTSLYDMFIIVIMLFLNVLIQLPIFILCFNILKVGHFMTTMIFEVAKVLLLLLLNKKMNKYYIKGKRLWDNNNFYIRYIFSCSMFIYVIVTVILKVIMPFVR